MKITNLKTYKVWLSFIEPNGLILDASGYAYIHDKYAGYSSLQQMITDGVIQKESFDIGEQTTSSPFSKDPYNYVSLEQFNSFSRGLFQISAWTTTGTVSASATPYSFLNTKESPYDLTVKNVLVLKFDSLTEVPITLPSGIIDLTGLVDALNNHSVFNKFGVASDSTQGLLHFLKIASKAVGPSSKVEILPHAQSAVVELGLESPVVTQPTGTVATVTITTLGTTGQGLQGVIHKCQLRKAAAPGVGDGNSTEFKCQRITEGSIENDQLYKSEFYAASGPLGTIKFEVGCAVAITELGDWLDVDIPITYFLSKKPLTRLQVY